MTNNKKSCQCGCEKKQQKQPKQNKKEHKKCGCACKCEQKFYFPLPNLSSQPVNGETLKPLAWFAPGSVESCCAICSTVQPVYANPCNTCRYPKGACPINNTAYFITNEYVY